MGFIFRNDTFPVYSVIFWGSDELPTEAGADAVLIIAIDLS